MALSSRSSVFIRRDARDLTLSSYTQVEERPGEAQEEVCRPGRELSPEANQLACWSGTCSPPNYEKFLFLKLKILLSQLLMSCVVFCKPNYQRNALCENSHYGFWISLHVVISVVDFKSRGIIGFGV